MSTSAGSSIAVEQQQQHNVNNLLSNVNASTISILLIFGSITFATISLGARSFLLGDTIPIRAAIKATSSSNYNYNNSSNNGNVALQPTFLSIYITLWQLMILGIILFITYIIEHSPPFPNDVRSEFDSDYMMFLIIIMCFIAGFSVKKCSDTNDGDAAVNTAIDKKKIETLSLHQNKDTNKKEDGQQINLEDSSTTNNTKSDTTKLTKDDNDDDTDDDEGSYENKSTESQSQVNKNMDTILLDEDLFSTTISGSNSTTYTKNNNSSVTNNNSISGQVKIEEATSDNDILNINQTLEWKGWMSLCFILYQYTNAGHGYYNTSSAVVMQQSQETSISSNSSSDDIVEIVNLGRIIPSMFLFISGYTHFTYFYTTSNYNMNHILRTIFKLNFMCFLLCTTHSNPYILYYICPLHSYYFLGIFVLMRYRNREWNYNRWMLRFKLFIGGVVIFVLFDLSPSFSGTLFKLLHLPFFTVGPMGMNGAKLGPMWEWYFRTSLDHWAAYFGMIFAANLPIISLLQRKLESYTAVRTIISKSFVSIALGSAVLFWIKGPIINATIHQYCKTHSYFCIFTILAYIYFRNFGSVFRNHCIYIFKWNGYITLEIFLLHHHLFLTSSDSGGGNGSGSASSSNNTVLTLLPGWPKCNILFVTIIFIYVCRKVHILTMYLRDALLPSTSSSSSSSQDNNNHDNSQKSSKVLGIMCVLFACSYATSVTLEKFNLVTPSILIMICIFCGVLLYQSITDMTWRNYYTNILSKTNASSIASSYAGSSRRRGRSSTASSSRQQHNLLSDINISDDEDNYDDNDDQLSIQTNDTIDEMFEMMNNPIVKVSPPIIGAFSLFVLGLAWNALFLRGANTTLRLPPNCEIYANSGEWIPINVCNNFQRGVAYRQYHATGGFANYCVDDDTSESALKVWGWLENPPNSQCLFTTRDSNNMNVLLNDRNFIFIGDGMVKNLFHSFCKTLLSDKTAGAYDATAPKHADITKYFETTKVQYQWAPLAIDQLEKLKDLRKVATEDVDIAPSLIIIGGGAWDRLHVWATDEDQESLRNTIKKLSNEISKLDINYGIPVVWMKPTTIHTKALNAEEKRSQMSEMALEEMRSLYSAWGIDSSVSFLLDGRVFTRQRVQESYDGIHYPIDVYDAGVQILANAMDWLLPPSTNDVYPSQYHPPPEPGMFSNPSLGLMMICFAFIGLFFFDGYLGFSYLSSLVVNGIMPNDLYEEAFWPIHRRWKLPLSSSRNSTGFFSWMNRFIPWIGSGGDGDGGSRNGNDERIGLMANSGSAVGTDLELIEEIRAR